MPFSILKFECMTLLDADMQSVLYVRLDTVYSVCFSESGETVWSPCYIWAISEHFRDKELIYKALCKFSCLLCFQCPWQASVVTEWFCICTESSNYAVKLYIKMKRWKWTIRTCKVRRRWILRWSDVYNWSFLCRSFLNASVKGSLKLVYICQSSS